MSEIVPEEIANRFIKSDKDFRGSEPELIDWDRDSAVFSLSRVGKVLKVYTGDIDKEPTPLDKLYLYKEVTNRASELAQDEGWAITLPGYSKSVPVAINPIESVTWRNDFGCGVAVSRYIDGSTARQVFFTTMVDDPTRETNEKDTYWWDKFPETNAIRKFLVSQGLVYPHKVAEVLYNFDSFMNKKLGTEGIFVGENNYKVVFDPKNITSPIRLVATDLCVDLPMLKRR
jgi:hypothetical protein